MQSQTSQSRMGPGEPPPPPRPPPPPPQVLFFGEFTHPLGQGQLPKDGEVDEVRVAFVARSTTFAGDEIPYTLTDSRVCIRRHFVISIRLLPIIP